MNVDTIRDSDAAVMETNMDSQMKMKENNDTYRLERWIAAALALLFLLPFVAQAQTVETPAPGLVTLAEYEGAGLLLKTSLPGSWIVAPVVSTDVAISVSGPVVRTRVRQLFRNDTAHCVEGIYLFPLPETSGVDTLRMIVGSRVIIGEVHEQSDAVKIYEQAKSEGKKASLVEQVLPNVFTTSVASLAPGDEVTIEIEYQDLARFEKGQFSLRFPVTVADRYTPAASSAQTVFKAVPPSGPAAKLTLAVTLDAGFPVTGIHSPHHHITSAVKGSGVYDVRLDTTATDGRDFELVWEPLAGSSPSTAVLTEVVDGQTYALVMVTPPATLPVSVPRDVVFVIDSSGSMNGESMEQARKALLLALDDLRPQERFNVIDFDDQARALFPETRFADAAAIEAAKSFVHGLEADGGTEILKAFQLALSGNQNASAGVLQQVVFLTDGQVGNEQEVFEYITRNLGDRRLFTVGIGGMPNAYFMRNAARFGRGTFTFIGETSQVTDRMQSLFAKLSSPVLTGVEVSAGSGAEVWPSRVPDLYSSEPVVVTIRLAEASSPIRISGMIEGKPWSTTVSAKKSAPGAGIARLWGRQKIETLMDGLSEGIDPATVRTNVLAVALEHHLLSQFTSLVAVDRTPEGAAEPSCISAPIPVQGGGAVGASLPQTATPAMMYLLAAALLFVVSGSLARFLR